MKIIGKVILLSFCLSFFNGCALLALPCGAARIVGSVPVVGAPALLPKMACNATGY